MIANPPGHTAVVFPFPNHWSQQTPARSVNHQVETDQEYSVRDSCSHVGNQWFIHLVDDTALSQHQVEDHDLGGVETTMVQFQHRINLVAIDDFSVPWRRHEMNLSSPRWNLSQSHSTQEILESKYDPQVFTHEDVSMDQKHLPLRQRHQLLFFLLNSNH